MEGLGERGEGGRAETKTGRKGRRRREIRGGRRGRLKKGRWSGQKKKCIKSGKKQIKLTTNLMDITEAEFPPEVQNMRALE